MGSCMLVESEVMEKDPEQVIFAEFHEIELKINKHIDSLVDITLTFL